MCFCPLLYKCMLYKTQCIPWFLLPVESKLTKIIWDTLLHCFQVFRHAFLFKERNNKLDQTMVDRNVIGIACNNLPNDSFRAKRMFKAVNSVCESLFLLLLFYFYFHLTCFSVLMMLCFLKRKKKKEVMFVEIRILNFILFQKYASVF